MPYYVHLGPHGLCPDCGEPTSFQLASLLREVRLTSWEVPRDLLTLLYKGVVKNFRNPIRKDTSGDLPRFYDKKALSCAKCRGRCQKMFWSEIVDGGVVGPFCKRCLLEVLDDTFSDERGLREDVPVYIAPANKGLLEEARKALAQSASPLTGLPALGDDDVILF